MKIEDIENILGIELPERHKRAMLNPRDPIHSMCDFLLPRSTDKMPDIPEENRRLHNTDIDPWPSHLVAFASNGCGDFFAYDVRSRPYPIIYVDPDRTVQENLGAGDKLTFTTRSRRLRRGRTAGLPRELSLHPDSDSGDGRFALLPQISVHSCSLVVPLFSRLLSLPRCPILSPFLSHFVALVSVRSVRS